MSILNVKETDEKNYEVIKKERLKKLKKKLFINPLLVIIAITLIAALVVLSPLTLASLLTPCTIFGLLAIKLSADTITAVKEKKTLNSNESKPSISEPLKNERNKSIWDVIFSSVLTTVGIVAVTVFDVLKNLATLIIPIVKFVIAIANIALNSKKTQEQSAKEPNKKEIKKLRVFAGLTITSAVIAITLSIAVAVVTGGWGLLIGAMITSTIAIVTASNYIKKAKRLIPEPSNIIMPTVNENKQQYNQLKEDIINAYKFMNLKHGVDLKTLTKTYHELALKCNPNIFENKSKFQELNNAHELLKRFNYSLNENPQHKHQILPLCTEEQRAKILNK